MEVRVSDWAQAREVPVIGKQLPSFGIEFVSIAGGRGCPGKPGSAIFNDLEVVSDPEG